MSKQTGISVQQMTQRLGVGVGNPDQVAENLKKYIEAGLGLITTSYYQSEDIIIFSKEVMPQLK